MRTTRVMQEPLLECTWMPMGCLLLWLCCVSTGASALAAQRMPLERCGFVPAVRYSDVSGSSVAQDANIQYLRACNRVVTAATLEGYPALRGLWLHDCAVDWKGLVTSACFARLEEFRLYESCSFPTVGVDDSTHGNAAWACLGKMKALRRISMKGCLWVVDEDDAMESALRMMENLEAVVCEDGRWPEKLSQLASKGRLRHVAYGYYLDSAQIERLCEDCELVTLECGLEGDAAEVKSSLLRIAREASLESLAVRGASIHDMPLPVDAEVLGVLAERKLQVLYLQDAVLPADAAVDALKRMEHVRTFGLVACVGVSKAALLSVVAHPLDRLLLDTELTAELLAEVLSACRALSYLELGTAYGPDLNAEAVAAIVDLPQLTAVVVEQGMDAGRLVKPLAGKPGLRAFLEVPCLDSSGRVGTLFRDGVIRSAVSAHVVGDAAWEGFAALVCAIAAGELEALALSGHAAPRAIAELLGQLPRVQWLDLAEADVRADDDGFVLPKRVMEWVHLRVSSSADVSVVGRLAQIRWAVVSLDGDIAFPMEGDRVEFGSAPALARLELERTIQPAAFRLLVACPSLLAIRCSSIAGMTAKEKDKWLAKLRIEYPKVYME